MNTTHGWEIFEGVSFFNTDYQDLNKNFSDKEKESAKQSISIIKENVKSLDVSIDTLNIIDQKLDELNTKVDELSKFDWKSLFIGTIASLIMTLSIPPESAGFLWQIIKSSFTTLKLNE